MDINFKVKKISRIATHLEIVDTKCSRYKPMSAVTHPLHDIYGMLGKDKKAWQTSRPVAPIESFAIFTVARAAPTDYLDPDRSIVNRINSVRIEGDMEKQSSKFDLSVQRGFLIDD